MSEPSEPSWRCADCRHLLVDLSHPNTDGESIKNQRGWICFAPEFYEIRDGKVYKQAFSQWNIEWGCEMFEERRNG